MRVSGTYSGQWLRGVRHGYGVRQSVSYALAARFPLQSAFAATAAAAAVSVAAAPPGVEALEKEDDILLRERDWRVEESRGGFVLLARTQPVGDSASHRRMVLDKHGKPSIRKTIVSVSSLCSVLFCSLAVLGPWVGHTMDVYFIYLSLSSVILIDSSTESPVHVLMLSIQAVRGLPRLRAPGIVPSIISFSRQLPRFLMV